MEGPYSRSPLHLGDREFRLLKLDSSAELRRIACSLHCFSLDSSYPDYIALSYTWGGNQRHDDIDLNGHRFPVGRNLWQFLDRMRLQEQDIFFWIDAVCIDQSNITEQNHQVQMMRDIYSNAQSVTIWLGETDETAGSSIGMQYLLKRKPLEPESGNFGNFWSVRQAKGVLGLCERKYLRRIWIVQEVILARQAIICCGSEQIDWCMLEQLVKDLQILSNRGRETHTPLAAAIFASPAFVIAKAKALWNGKLQPLTMLLELYCDHEATDIRDKIYALHGLAKDSSDTTIDYSKPAKEVYIDALRHVCAEPRSINGIKRPTKKLVYFGKRMVEILKVHVDTDGIEYHISVATERGNLGKGPEATSQRTRHIEGTGNSAAAKLQRRGKFEEAKTMYRLVLDDHEGDSGAGQSSNTLKCK